MIKIEIDCSPESTRPDDIYDAIIDEIKDVLQFRKIGVAFHT